MNCSIESFRVRALVGVDTVVPHWVTDGNNEPVTPASLSKAYLQIFGPDETAIHNAALDLAETFSTSLRQGPEWTADAVGYNLAVTLPGSGVADETFRYPAIVWCVPTSGSDFPIRMLVELTPVPKADYPD